MLTKVQPQSTNNLSSFDVMHAKIDGGPNLLCKDFFIKMQMLPQGF